MQRIICAFPRCIMIVVCVIPRWFKDDRKIPRTFKFPVYSRCTFFPFSFLYPSSLFRTNFSSPYCNVIRQNVIPTDPRLSVFRLFPSTGLFKFLPWSAMVHRSMLLATSLEKRKHGAQTTSLDVLETRRIASCHRTYEAIHTFPSSRQNIQRDKNIGDTVRD